MLSRYVERRTRRRFGDLSRGDASSVLRLYASDVRFSYRGRSALAAELTGSAELERWFARMFEELDGPRFEVLSVASAGSPLRLLVVTDYLVTCGPPAEPTRMRGLQAAELRRGRIVAETIAVSPA